LFILRNVNAGHGRLVVLAGEPGVGKIRLAHEVLQHARAGGALVFQGSCFAEHSDVPFLPFATALRSAEAQAQPDGPDSWPELALIVPESGSVPSLEGRYTQLRLFQAATGLLIALAATRPVVLQFCNGN
jgi:predicted ATPase